MPGVAELIDGWLAARLDAATLEWLRGRAAAARGAGADSSFLLAWSSVPRRVGKANLALASVDLEAAATTRPGFRPVHWTVDQAARTLLLLALPAEDVATYCTTLERLFDDGDLGELGALYQALPLLPHPERHRARAAEGIRANMQPVFEAIALRNPYPAEQLEDAAFNQLVLKCLFLGARLADVYGIDTRANATLARMLGDYAHERWAAGRPVPPELWRAVGPYATGSLLDDLERVLATGSERERAAVALGARGNGAAAGLLSTHAEAVAGAVKKFPTWESIAAG